VRVVSQALAGGGNFLIPNMTFVVELVAFLIVLGVLWRYVIPPVQQAMNVRQEMARKLVSDSEEAKELLEKAQTAYNTATADARHEAARLRAQAEQQRREIVEGASTEAEAGVAEIISRGQAQVEAERRQAVRQLKTDLGNLAVELAEKILGEALADNQRQERLIERFLSHIEEEANAGTSRACGVRIPAGYPDWSAGLALLVRPIVAADRHRTSPTADGSPHREFLADCSRSFRAPDAPSRLRPHRT
jgi:F-type H+-transporting ATPase subunit b